MSTLALPPLQLRPTLVIKDEANRGAAPAQFVEWAKRPLPQTFLLSDVRWFQKSAELGYTNILLYNVALTFETISQELMLTNVPPSVLEPLERYVGQPFQLTDHLWLPADDHEWTGHLRLEYGSIKRGVMTCGRPTTPRP